MEDAALRCIAKPPSRGIKVSDIRPRDLDILFTLQYYHGATTRSGSRTRSSINQGGVLCELLPNYSGGSDSKMLRTRSYICPRLPLPIGHHIRRILTPSNMYGRNVSISPTLVTLGLARMPIKHDGKQCDGAGRRLIKSILIL